MGNESLYNENYYKFCCGELPYDDPRWLPFFEGIANRIVDEINPKTVLDVGCAMGHLVTALRNRGVEAYGIDVSEYAISMVKEENKPYCRVHSALEELPEDFPKSFDLVTTIEVAEHLREEECEQFIKNICSYTNNIIFSSTPDDFQEQTHFNVQQIEYWAKRFAKNNFLRDINYSCKYISPQAVRFNKSDKPFNFVVEDYERYVRQELTSCNNEKMVLKESFENQKKELEESLNYKTQRFEIQKKELEESLNCKTQRFEIQQKELEDIKNQYNSLAEELEQLNQEYKEKLIEHNKENCALSEKNKQLEENIENALAQVNAKQGEINFLCSQVIALEATIAEINGSRCYRIINVYYKFRNFIIPKGSKRFVLAKIIFKFPQYALKGYPFKLIGSLFKNGIRKTWKKIKKIVLCDTASPVECHIAPKYRAENNLHIVPKHQQNVDIIICVHNAYDDVKRCIESLFEYTSYPYNVIIVDDGSDTPTKDYLAEIAENCPNVKLIRNEKGQGYTFAANIGLRASQAEYCVLLNSDTIVTKNWIDNMIDCAQSDPLIGIVGPLSNTASWQSIPNVFDEDGDWCHNKLPDDITVENYAEMVEKYSGQLYFNVPLLNGFCIMIHRKVIESIGYLDEGTFGPGFGEEDDYNLRALKAGFKLAVADNTYVFHAQSKSYSDERRKLLCEKSGKKLREKHGDTVLDNAVHIVHKSRVFEGIRVRANIMTERERLINQARKNWEGKRILFILPIADAGGGANVVIQEASIMMKMGIEVSLYNLLAHKTSFESAYPSLKIPVIYGNKLEDFRNHIDYFDVICSTLYTSVKFCNIPGAKAKMAYYIQDYEPYFFSKGSSEYTEAEQSYTIIPDIVRVTKTNWNAREVEKHHNVKCNIIGPSVDIDTFRPRKHFQNSHCVKIAAMVRPESPRRAPAETMAILREIEHKYNNQVKIMIFGADVENSPNDRAFFETVKNDFSYEFLGKLNPVQVSSLLADCDIFVDFSEFQAMGLTAMEAMASGCAVIVPKNGGADTFAKHNENALVVDTGNTSLCVHALDMLIKDSALRERLSLAALTDICNYSPEHSAFKFLSAVLGNKED